MAFPGSPETDLILSLHAAMLDTDGWPLFLGRLARMTGARFATVVSRVQGGDPVRDIASAMPDGMPVSVDAALLGIVLTERMRPERIYSAADFAELGGASSAGLPAGLGATAVRAVRAVVPGGTSLTLAIFGVREFDAADGAVLRQIFPYLQDAVRAAGRIARERFRAAVTAGLSRPAALGWLLLDRDGVVLDATVEDMLLPGVRVVSGPQGGRLSFASGPVAARWAAAVERATGATATADRAIWVSDRPAAYLRLAPFVPWRQGPYPAAAAIATLHGRCAVPSDRGIALADLFGLSASEAKLAIALANGDSLAEAAAARGLTIETARNYSKRIFAKTGARGQADLVRLIYAYGLAEPPGGIVAGMAGADATRAPANL